MAHGPLYLQSPLWAAVFFISFIAMFAHESWVFSRDRRQAKGERRDRGSLQAIIVLQNLGFLSAFTIPWATDQGAIPIRPEIAFWTAISLFWVGFLLRFWSVITLGRFFRTTVLVQDEHELITHGPYRFLRNPSYTGGLMMLAGLGLGQGNIYSVLAITAGGLLGYVWRIRVEDAALCGRFGDAYEAYRRRSWALIPPIW